MKKRKREILSLTGGLFYSSFVVSTIFIKNTLIEYVLALVASVFIFLILFHFRHFETHSIDKPGSENHGITEEETGSGSLEEKSFQIKEPTATIEKLENHILSRKKLMDEVLEQLVMFIDAVEKEQVFSDIIKTKTEEATLKLTDYIYEIVESGKRMSSEIKKVFDSITSGENSLETSAHWLVENTEEISGTIDQFRKISRDFEHDQNIVQQMVSNISHYTHDITEVADLTHIIGINASIEAARAGLHGTGFAVISREVRELALRAKEIADRIKVNVGETSASVMSSYKTQHTRIQTAINSLEKTRSIQGEIVSAITDKINETAVGADSSHRLSLQITAHLDQVTVHLQYQDMIRQVLEHMLEYLLMLKKGSQTFLETADHNYVYDEAAIAARMLERLKTLFTTQEENEAFGVQINRESDRIAEPVSKRGRETDFDGDVTLF